MPQIQGSKAVVVGGSHGIGLATTQLLISRGAKVIVTGRNAETLESAKKGLGDGAVIHIHDVTSIEAISIMAHRVSETFGSGPQFDLVFVNAGHASLEPFTAVSQASFRRTFDTNVFGALFVVQALSLLAKPGDSIVFTTSIANRRDIPGMAIYSASRVAVHSFVQTMAAELATKNIRVNAISPGHIKTPTMGVADTSKKTWRHLKLRVRRLHLWEELGALGKSRRRWCFWGTMLPSQRARGGGCR